MISVARRRGLDAMSPRVWRIRGMASPITGTAGRSSSRRVGRIAGSTVPSVARTAVAVGVGVGVGVGLGVVEVPDLADRVGFAGTVLPLH